MSESIALNCDCMEYMRALPDKAFDLAVVDPPYGDGLGDAGGVQQVWWTVRPIQRAERGTTDSGAGSTSTKYPPEVLSEQAARGQQNTAKKS